jgi:hypothetical protein
MHAFVSLLKNSPQMVQVQVMPAIAALSGPVGTQLFKPYYREVVDLMKEIIVRANTPQMRLLRAKAMECVSFIGMYVGRDMFFNDARDIMTMFMHIMAENEQKNAQLRAAGQGNKAKPFSGPITGGSGEAGALDDDYSQQFMLQAWARICSCLGKEFVPILPHVMPLVFEAITRKGEGEFERPAGGWNVHKLDQDSGEESGGDDEDPNVDKHGNVRAISIAGGQSAQQGSSFTDRPMVLHYTSRAHTAAMEEKAMAASLLCSIAFDLREDFIEYVQRSAEIMVPLVEHPHDEVQEFAISCLPHLMKSAVLAQQKGKVPVEYVRGYGKKSYHTVAFTTPYNVLTSNGVCVLFCLSQSFCIDRKAARRCLPS